jgi:hypothetical protein
MHLNLQLQGTCNYRKCPQRPVDAETCKVECLNPVGSGIELYGDFKPADDLCNNRVLCRSGSRQMAALVIFSKSSISLALAFSFLFVLRQIRYL